MLPRRRARDRRRIAGSFAMVELADRAEPAVPGEADAASDA